MITKKITCLFALVCIISVSVSSCMAAPNSNVFQRPLFKTLFEKEDFIRLTFRGTVTDVIRNETSITFTPISVLCILTLYCEGKRHVYPMWLQDETFPLGFGEPETFSGLLTDHFIRGSFTYYLHEYE